MIRAIPKANRTGFRLNYSCPCGADRAVFGQDIVPSLPLEGSWRATGPCRECGAVQNWRVLDRPDYWVIEVERR